MQNELITTEYRIKINANNICLTECTEWTGADLNKKRTIQHENLKNNSTKGLLSPKAIKRLKSSINWLVVASEKKRYYSIKEKKHFHFKINFVTLTIPPQKGEMVTEKQFKTLLNTWLTYHRKYSGLNNYVWKIETHKDKTLHIHLSTDTFIYYKKVESSWNLILKRNGLLNAHFAKYGNYTPPSCQIKAVEKVRKLGAYMAKYMTKDNVEDRLFSGRVWGCSMKISKVLSNVHYVCPDIISKVTKPIFTNTIKTIEIFTKPNSMGRKWKVADIYLMNLEDWAKIKGSILYGMFKDLVMFLRLETPRHQELFSSNNFR